MPVPYHKRIYFQGSNEETHTLNIETFPTILNPLLKTIRPIPNQNRIEFKEDGTDLKFSVSIVV